MLLKKLKMKEFHIQYFIILSHLIKYFLISGENTSIKYVRITMDLNESSSKQLSECQYLESLTFRLGDNIEHEFNDILKGMNFKY